MKHKANANKKPQNTSSGWNWIMLLLNLCCATAFAVVYLCSPDTAAFYYLLSLPVVILILANIIFVLLSKRHGRLPKSRYITVFGSLSIALAELCMLLVFLNLSGLVKTSTWDQVGMTTISLTFFTIFAMLMSVIFFTILKAVGVKYGLKTYIAITVAFLVISSVIDMPYGSVGDFFRLMVLGLPFSLGAGVVATVAGQLVSIIFPGQRKLQSK